MYGLAHQDLHKQDYQKDAIYRQMLEYKREKATLETRLAELAKKAAHHDDHLRIVDAWWLQVSGIINTIAADAMLTTAQLIEEIGLMAQGVALQSSDDGSSSSNQ